MSVRVDLHCHSSVSDGTMSPTEVVERAAAAGLDVMALTDHDTAGGWDEGAAAARRVGIGFVPGIELSTKHAGEGVHLLGYLVDASYAPLVAELGRILAGRAGRLAAMVDQLAAAGVDISADDVRRIAGRHGVVGRPHVADAMVARGLAVSRAHAFDVWLNPGRPGFVVRYAPSTVDMVRLVNAAGGAAVVAHPWGRGSRRVLDADALAMLTSAGLVGIEVDHEDHSDSDRQQLRGLADELGLVVTGASDYHGLGKVDHELGCNLTAPAELERLLAAAAGNAAAAGRGGAGVVAATSAEQRR